MSSFHIVQQGEHLSGIAAKFGFSSFRTIWQHPENAELKKLRKDPNPDEPEPNRKNSPQTRRIAEIFCSSK
jgi:hypothetical protein